MGVRLFKASGGQGEISFDGSFTNPILWEVSQQGGILERKYFVRMESLLDEYATDCRIYATDGVDEDETSWVTFAFEENGGPGEYQSELNFHIPLGSEIPVWIRTEVPEAVTLGAKTDVKVEISYIRHEAQ